ncbi:hypothetical protein JVU11DRAFT_7538 [Chiua virens]|nr:hypothetical protein JVU11DRAFT_7538 [Chiua virens]
MDRDERCLCRDVVCLDSKLGCHGHKDVIDQWCCTLLTRALSRRISVDNERATRMERFIARLPCYRSKAPARPFAEPPIEEFSAEQLPVEQSRSEPPPAEQSLDEQSLEESFSESLESFAEPPSTEFMQIDSIRKKFGRFRILIVGRANAGKTTILKQICNSTEDPVIYDPRGKKVNPEKLQESRDRGMHDIENELVFRSNPNFVFHDSQGFEAGSIEEFRQMKHFVSDRAKTTFLKKRIHAIWYCIPMDQYHRAVLAAEEKFFGDCDTGNVPVVLVFTKCDALLVQGIAALTAEETELPQEERVAKGQHNANMLLKENPTWERVQRMKYPPKICVELRDLHKSNEGCILLLERTVVALDGEVLQMLLVTAQCTNMMLCIEYALKR